jgi:hypothetical protein
MPLYPNAHALIRANLERAANRQKPPIVRIGTLSEDQLKTINAQRLEEELPAIVAEILFDGRHMYNSRCVEDGYTIDDVLDQITSAFSDSAEVAPGWVTVLVNRTPRTDRFGKTIRDEAVFECHGKHPHPELLSVVPRGDGKDHFKKKKATR